MHLGIGVWHCNAGVPACANDLQVPMLRYVTSYTIITSVQTQWQASPMYLQTGFAL